MSYNSETSLIHNVSKYNGYTFHPEIKIEKNALLLTLLLL